MTWILMKFRQIIEESHSFSSKKTASKSERYISVSKAFKFAYFCPYNPYFSVHFCHKILRGGGSRILPARDLLFAAPHGIWESRYFYVFSDPLRTGSY